MTHISKEDADDCMPNHLCKGRVVHLPLNELCDRCGGSALELHVYHVEATGNDGKTYCPRLLQTREEMEQFQKVGIVGEIMRIHSMESVPDMALTGRLQ